MTSFPKLWHWYNWRNAIANLAGGRDSCVSLPAQSQSQLLPTPPTILMV
ncbi:MAG: hypothetical protein WBG73_23245 [Coleofasciculaceae cyanobacterium]